MSNYYGPCDFSNIVGYPHEVPEKAVDKLPSFQGDNVTSAKAHIRNFNLCIARWCMAHNHEDVKMKLFVLSLEEEAIDWFMEHDDNKFKDLKGIIEAFNNKWGDKRDHHSLLTALHFSHKEDNETVEGFNRRFNELVKSLPQDIKPPEKAILIFYIQAFKGEMRYQLRDKEPTNFREAQDKAIKIDKNMQDSGKSNVLGFSKYSPPE